MKLNYRLIILFSLFFLLFTIQNSISQGEAFGRNFHFQGIATDSRFMVRESSIFTVPDTAIYWAFRMMNKYSFEKGWDKNGSVIKNESDSSYRQLLEIGLSLKNEPKSPIMLGVKLDPSLKKYRGAEVNSFSKTFQSYTISDSSDAILIALGITPDNVNDFQYRVVENDSVELIPWSSIPRMEQKYGAKTPYAFLGKFNSPGKQLFIEVVNMKNYNIRDGVVFDFRKNHKPVIKQIIVDVPNGYFNLRYNKLNRNYATKFDERTGAPLDLKFPVNSISNFRVYFENHLTIPYAMYLKKGIMGRFSTERIDWWVLKDYSDFSSHNFSSPGKYEIIIQKAGSLNEYGEENTLRIPFEVTPEVEKKLSAKKVIFFGLISFSILLLLSVAYYLYSKKRQERIIRQKEKLGLQLKSLRSQLNPHFMFNALNSIQNLINKNEINAANHYLTKFASLTRKVLDISDKELVSLEDEITLLDDYLQMEKLRFGFEYELKTDSGLNKANLEIPSMLLQPLVENAVKHGVASLQEKGLIEIIITKKDTDLLLSIIDNGKGFQNKESDSDSSGLGLKLIKERIDLLNKNYSSQQISMEISSGISGTKVDIVLKNWL